MTTSPTGGAEKFSFVDRSTAPLPAAREVIDRVKTWRLALYTFAGVLVTSLAVSGSGMVATALAYVGAGGMLLSILGMAGAAVTGTGSLPRRTSDRRGAL